MLNATNVNTYKKSKMNGHALLILTAGIHCWITKLSNRIDIVK